MTSKAFSVHAFTSNIFTETSYAICTAYKNHGGYFRGESFLILRGLSLKPMVMATRISVTNNAGPDCPVEINEAYVQSEALSQARIDFLLQAQEVSEKTGYANGVPKLQIEPVEMAALVSLWVRNLAKDELAGICHNTQCQDLSSYLEKMYSLPTITFSRVSL